MQIVKQPNWSNTDSFRAGSGKYAGIAIGVGSEAGLVRVNGHVLASGRVLPLAGTGYQIEHIERLGDALDASTYLELYLFESCAEMACPIGRAQFRYSQDPIAAPAALTTLLTIPFGNRRHARFSVEGAGGCVIQRYVIVGFDSRSSDVRLADVSGTWSELGVHVGGTDNEEPWEQLTLQVSTNAIGTIAVEAVAIGDL